MPTSSSGVISPCDTGLVGNDNDQKTGFVQQPDRLRRSRDKLEILHPVQVVLFHIDGAVPINENGPLQLAVARYHLFKPSIRKPNSLNVLAITAQNAM